MAGSVSWWRVPDRVTSNPSTTIRGDIEAGSCSPVTSIVNVWLVSARPCRVNTCAWICSVGEYVLTVVTAPSRETREIPNLGPQAPIQLIPFRVQLVSAGAPGVFEDVAVPPLH